MGRIDEALRRAGRTRRDPDLPRGTDGPFVSPWSPAEGDFKGEAVAAIAPAPAAPRRPLHQRAEPNWVPLQSFAAGWRERLAIGRQSNALLADQFRRLAATLLQVQRGEKLRTVMVTSAHAADGKTITAVNLGLVLSESYGRRVLLVEGDLRRPAISRVAGVAIGPGLNEALKADDDRQPSLVRLTETLTLLPAGQPSADPLSALTSARFQALLQDASEKFDFVIVDSPPLAATTDATLLCPLVDAVLLVVRAGCTPLESVRQAIDALGRDRILGVVLNASEQAAEDGHGYEYYAATPTDSVVSRSLSLIPLQPDAEL